MLNISVIKPTFLICISKKWAYCSNVYTVLLILNFVILGLAQCTELCLQLRGEADKLRQVPNAKIALQHNLGLGVLFTTCFHEFPNPEIQIFKKNVTNRN